MRRLAEATAAMEGRLLAGDGETLFDAASIDSRQIAGGELFFALEGEHTDGHLWVADALARGAAAAVVHTPPPAPPPPGALIQVADTYRALHDLTRSVRSQVPRRLVAITGSAGKTTTKELLALMLARRFRVARSPGNLNNLYGFPVALLGIPDDTEWMVAEMGMSEPGELGRISRLGRPDVAVFTNVRPAHLDSFGELAAIGRAKAELLEGLAPEGLVVANAGDAEVVKIGRRHQKRDPPGRVVWYGLQDVKTKLKLRLRARDVKARTPGPGYRFVLAGDDGQVEVELPLHGGYNVENCLAAAACAVELGIPLADVAMAAGEARPGPGRGVLRHPKPEMGRELTVVDDVYNSNPDALHQALTSARELPGRRHWAILGDMLELGDAALEFHRRGGEEAADLGFDPVVGVGDLARELVRGAAAAGARTQWFPDSEAAAGEVLSELREGDVVLVKGSRGVALERVVQALVGSFEDAGDEEGDA